MSTAIDFTTLTTDKSSWKLLQQIHKAILSTSKDIEYRIFPIYIRYDDGERNVALLYYKGKHMESGEFDLGLNIGTTRRPKGFDNGEHMKYPGINCSIKLSVSSSLTKQLLDAIALTKL
jgi:hypothetical protein